MKFSYLSKEFHKLSFISSRNEIINHLNHLLSEATPKEARYICYFALGRLRAIFEGTQFNFGSKSVIKVVVELLNIDIEEFNRIYKNIGSIAQAIRESDWNYEDSGISLSEVHDKLIELEEISGVGSQEEKSNTFYNLLKSLDRISASYVISIVLGTLRMGFSDMTLLDTFSVMIAGDKSLKKDIERAYNVRADIGQIVFMLKTEGIEKLRELEPVIGIPIRPAAAERLNTPEEIIKKIGPCYAEPKLDGFRVQVHLKKYDNKQKIWFYSRNMQDMSNMFPDLVKSFSHCIYDQVILEGEAIVYSEEADCFLPFQETVKRKRKHEIEKASQEYPLRLYMFDILDINDKSTMDLPYIERRKLLKSIFGECDNSDIKVNDSKKCETVLELKNYFLEQISEGLEGLVVKRPNAPYTPGKRNFNWIKLKRTQEEHLTDTIDAIIMGYNYGRGRRSKFGIGAFLVGIYNKELDKIQTIAKVGTGLSDIQLKDLKNDLDKIKVLNIPDNYQVSKCLIPDVWVKPSIVVEVEAEEITKSPNHTAGLQVKQEYNKQINDKNISKLENNSGLALRFPRFLRYRSDKDVTQATEIEEILRLRDLQMNKNS